jgi:serine/threonine protein phosphatase PrpC
MTLSLRVAARTDVGRVRTGNEDTVLAAPEELIVAVADGMGGHQAGEVASATAMAAFVDHLHRGDSVGDAITRANDAVYAKASEDLSLRGMGTTLTAAVVDGSTLVIGHVGDSRAYLLRDGAMTQLTTDHSVVAELIAAGELTEAEAQADPRRAMITRALGIDTDVSVDVVAVDITPGDRLLLCSDGLTTMVPDDEIAAILARETDPEPAADALVRAANAAGGADNVSVVIADVAATTGPGATAEGDPLATPLVDAPPDGAPPATDPEEEIPAEPVPESRRRWWRRRSSP